LLVYCKGSIKADHPYQEQLILLDSFLIFPKFRSTDFSISEVPLYVLDGYSIPNTLCISYNWYAGRPASLFDITFGFVSVFIWTPSHQYYVVENYDCSVSSLVILCSCIVKGTLIRGQQLLHKNRNWQIDIQCFGWDFALKQENDLYISWVRQNVTAEVFLSVAGFFYYI
jgi:hypothetical protein